MQYNLFRKPIGIKLKMLFIFKLNDKTDSADRLVARPTSLIIFFIYFTVTQTFQISWYSFTYIFYMICRLLKFKI